MEEHIVEFIDWEGGRQENASANLDLMYTRRVRAMSRFSDSKTIIKWSESECDHLL